MKKTEKLKKSDAEWRMDLTPEQYEVLRLKGTETPFTGKYYNVSDSGMYSCVACGQELFSSESKFESGTGWPSFVRPVSEGVIELKPDESMGMERTEVLCGKCGGHLGHVFDDGPKLGNSSDNTEEEVGKRYCINSIALDLKEN